jgi:peptidoglycan hydrolase CwlO-like protein
VSVITKIFVVLATILAVLLVPLVIAYVNNTAEFRDRWLQTQQALRVAEQAAANAQADLQALQAAQNQTIANLEQDKSQLRGRIDELMSQLAQKDGELIVLRDQVASLTDQVSRLAAGNEQATQLIADLQQEVSDTREQWLNAQQQLVELNDQLQEKTTTVQTLTDRVRLLREQMTNLQDQLVEARQQQVARAEPQPAGAEQPILAPIPEQPIQGIVTKIDQVGGETFAEVNVGANDDVREDMQFIVHDAGQYVASLRITAVDLNRSVGRVTLADGEVHPNLQVLATE